MNCEETRRLLSCFHDGELEAAEREQIAAHVEICSNCADELAALAQLDRKSQLLRSLEPPPDLWDRIAQQLSADRVSMAAHTGVAKRRRFVLITGMLAASLVVGLLASTFVRRGRSDLASGVEAPAASSVAEAVMVNLSLLGPEDHRLAESQETCAADGCDVQLGAEGPPVKVVLRDMPVLCCSQECERWVRAHPEEAIAKARLLVHRHETRSGASTAP
jgi:hypothetical protein